MCVSKIEINGIVMTDTDGWLTAQDAKGGNFVTVKGECESCPFYGVECVRYKGKMQLTCEDMIGKDRIWKKLEVKKTYAVAITIFYSDVTHDNGTSLHTGWSKEKVESYVREYLKAHPLARINYILAEQMEHYTAYNVTKSEVVIDKV